MNEWTTGPRAGLLRGAALLTALLIAPFGCAPKEAAAPPPAPLGVSPVGGPAALVPVPAIDLSGAEPGARKQLEKQRTSLDALLADAAADPTALARAYGDLGLLYVVYEFLEAAEVCFADARALEPESFTWIYLLGYLKSIQGELPEAIPLFARTLELAPQYLPAVLRLGRARLEQGDYPAARSLFERALELDPRAAAAHEGLGKVAAAGGDPRAAIERLQRAVEIDPAATGLHYALGLAYRDLGDLDRARAELERGGDVPARIDDPLINPLASVAESAQFYLMQGGEALDDKDYETAAGAYQAALERDDAEFLAYRGLAVALEGLGDRDGAGRALERVLGRPVGDDPGRDRRERAEALRFLGDYAMLRSDDDGALGRWRESLALVPEQPAVLLKVGNALARQGRFADAVASYDRLAKQVPEAAPAILEKRATALINLGRHGEAVADFRRALEAAPQDARLRLRFAEALEFLGDRAGAARERAAAERLAPAGRERARLAVDEARRREAAGDYAAAIDQYREALAAAPGALDARHGLASVLGHVGRYEEAAGEFAAVVDASPRHLSAHRGRVVALILGGRYGEARMALQGALQLFPRNASLALTQVRLLAIAPDPRVRDGGLALEIAQRVYADSQAASVRDSLALALAATGRYAEAAVLERGLLAEAERAGDRAAIAGRGARLSAFEGGEPWSATSPEEIMAPLAER